MIIVGHDNICIWLQCPVARRKYESLVSSRLFLAAASGCPQPLASRLSLGANEIASSGSVLYYRVIRVAEVDALGLGGFGWTVARSVR